MKGNRKKRRAAAGLFAAFFAALLTSVQCFAALPAAQDGGAEKTRNAEETKAQDAKEQNRNMRSFSGWEKSFPGWESFGQTIYNTTNGLMSNNVSSIAQTSDGVIWIGTDEGLSAFDGNEFVEYGGFFHFDGVNDMVRTKDGGVWFATATYGGAIYLGSRFQHFDNISELVSNNAVSIAESADGSIYVGTVRNMALINPAAGYTVTELAAPEYFYANSLAAGQDNIVGGTTVNGDIFFLKDGAKLCCFPESFDGRGCMFYAEGYYLVGTSKGEILVFDGKNPDAGAVQRSKLHRSFLPEADGTRRGEDGADALPSGGINNFFYEDGQRLWVLAENSIGYYTMDGETPWDGNLDTLSFTRCSFDNFESGFTDMMTDYQGNYWISSSKRGLLLLAPSNFTDELSQILLDNDRVNAVMTDGGVMYAATDSGLIAVRQQDKAVLNDGRKGMLAGKRTVDMAFYKGELITAVYGEGVYAGGGYFDAAFDGGELLPIEAGRIRRLYTAEDSLYVLSDEGCFVWNGEQVTARYAQEEGLYNTKLTCALLGTFGRQNEERLYLGSEGAGIYVIANGQLEQCLDENSGLPSKNIHDMAAYENGFFIATDRGIGYYNGKKMTELKTLPEELSRKVCESLFIRGEKLYVICRDAVYSIDLENLFCRENGAVPKYECFDGNAGFFGTVTDGGRGFMDGNGRIYLPCTEKIYSFSDTSHEESADSYKLLLQSVQGDGRLVEISALQDGEYAVKLTKDIEKLDIFCSVLNFSNSDPYVRYILHGVDNDYTTLRSSELEHIIYEEPPGGSYTFWFELLDQNQETMQRIVLTVDKEEAFFEKLWVRMAGLFAAFGVLMYFVFKDRKGTEL